MEGRGSSLDFSITSKSVCRNRGKSQKKNQANLRPDRYYSGHTRANTSEVQSSFSCTMWLNDVS
jgi:hypothetical protein